MHLALLEDRLEEGERLRLDAAPRVVYVVAGAIGIVPGAIGGLPGAISGPPGATGVAADTFEENTAWHGSDACTAQAHRVARLWRWELLADGASPMLGSETTLKLAHEIEMPAGGALMRADRVDFPPKGIAYTHTHQGPGIRVLLRGRFRVKTNGHVLELGPGAPWFERGPDPVYAEVIGDAAASFVRVMVLPIALLGRSSIRYVNAEDQAQPKSQTYTVFIDAPLSPVEHTGRPSPTPFEDTRRLLGLQDSGGKA